MYVCVSMCPLPAVVSKPLATYFDQIPVAYFFGVLKILKCVKKFVPGPGILYVLKTFTSLFSGSINLLTYIDTQNVKLRQRIQDLRSF